MRFFRARKHEPSQEAHESVVRAQDDLAVQRKKHEQSQALENRLVDALERNHLAELMLHALERKMS